MLKLLEVYTLSYKGYIGIGMKGIIARNYDKNAKNYSLEQYKG
jgi:hypothetical protein